MSSYLVKRPDGKEVGIGVWQLPDREHPSLVIIGSEDRVVASFKGKEEALAFQDMLEEMFNLNQEKK